MSQFTIDAATAFNEGSDCRLRGIPMHHCPYPAGYPAYYWRQGWQSVHTNWGVDVRGRWLIRSIPHLG